MNKKFAIISTAALLALGWILGTGGSAFATTPTYTLTAWQLGAGSTVASPWVTPQTKVAEIPVTDESLSQLDASSLLTCGNIYQIDIYTTPNIGTILTGPSTPNAESFPNDSAPHWKYITEPLCNETWPTASQTCDSYTLPALDANAKYELNSDGSRPVAGTFPLSVGEVVGPFTAHTLASLTNYNQSSTTFGPFTGTACATPTPTPSSTPPVGIPNPPVKPALAYTGTSINPGEPWLIGGLVLMGVGAIVLGKRRRLA